MVNQFKDLFYYNINLPYISKTCRAHYLLKIITGAFDLLPMNRRHRTSINNVILAQFPSAISTWTEPDVHIDMLFFVLSLWTSFAYLILFRQSVFDPDLFSNLI